MLAAARHAGGALVRRIPAAGSLWRAAVNGERPALQQSLQQYPRGIHRPAAASRAAAFSTTASTQVDIPSSEPNGCSKESEEEKKKRKRMAAMMLMKSHCTDDRESEIKSINELFSLLDPANEYNYSELTELQERRSLFEKKKNALLIALLSGDAQQEKEKMAELAAAGRLLRDAVSGRYQLHGQPRELEEDRTLSERVLEHNRIVLEMLDTLKGSAADNKAMLERYGEKHEELKESVESIDEKQEELKESVESIDEKHGELKESVESIGEKQEELKESVESVQESLNEVKESVNEVKESMEGIEESVEQAVKDSMEEAVKEWVKEPVEEAVKDSMESMEESMNELKDTIERVESSVDKLVDRIGE